MGWPPLERWGGYTGVAGVSFFRTFDEASEGPACGAGCAGQRGALGLCAGTVVRRGLGVAANGRAD